MTIKDIERLRKECVPIEMDDVFDTCEKALRVVEAAKAHLKENHDDNYQSELGDVLSNFRAEESKS